MAAILRTLTVAQLLDVLEGEDLDSSVVVACDYGDIGHTQQVIPLRGTARLHQVEESTYSNSGWALVPIDDEEDGRLTVLVIG